MWVEFILAKILISRCICDLVMHHQGFFICLFVFFGGVVIMGHELSKFVTSSETSSTFSTDHYIHFLIHQSLIDFMVKCYRSAFTVLSCLHFLGSFFSSEVCCTWSYRIQISFKKTYLTHRWHPNMYYHSSSE